VCVTLLFCSSNFQHSSLHVSCYFASPLPPSLNYLEYFSVNLMSGHHTAKITSVLLVCPSFSCIYCRHTCFSKHPVGTVFELQLLSALPELFITAVLTVQTWSLVLALRYPFIICQCYKTTLFQSAQFAN